MKVAAKKSGAENETNRQVPRHVHSAVSKFSLIMAPFTRDMLAPDTNSTMTPPPDSSPSPCRETDASNNLHAELEHNYIELYPH